MDTRDPTYATALALSIETALNASLQYDPGSRASLPKLHDKVLAIESEQGNLYLHAVDEHIYVLAHYSGEATATLKGEWLTLLMLIFNPSHSLAGSGVNVSGQVSLLADYQHFMKNLDIDWEDALSQKVGDLPAHYAAKAFKGLFNTLKPRALRTPQFISEFLTEELRAVPTVTELERFNQTVNTLRQQSERLDARVNKLLASISSQQHTQQH
ncbi:ubiquinone biosynthesis accessory factor UbiJ [Teredinibacter purpureus]|uniref:ubiquinone biosynthesis accessory factor UbiJ n=1 Tax=Teredinibacter purpureus TaxID=2731756 RepID=UPI0005F77711|nr:hypothetical protein [Teredinibacter purpureus]